MGARERELVAPRFGDNLAEAIEREHAEKPKTKPCASALISVRDPWRTFPVPPPVLSLLRPNYFPDTRPVIFPVVFLLRGAGCFAQAFEIQYL